MSVDRMATIRLMLNGIKQTKTITSNEEYHVCPKHGQMPDDAKHCGLCGAKTKIVTRKVKNNHNMWELANETDDMPKKLADFVSDHGNIPAWETDGRTDISVTLASTDGWEKLDLVKLAKKIEKNRKQYKPMFDQLAAYMGTIGNRPYTVDVVLAYDEW